MANHIQHDHFAQLRMENSIRSDLATRRKTLPAEEFRRYAEASIGCASGSRNATPQVIPLASDASKVTARNSQLVAMFEARRAAADGALLPKFDVPKPCVRLAYKAPAKAPAGQDSESWEFAANRLERPAVVRLLGALEERLQREQREADRLEAKLGRVEVGRLAALSSVDIEKAKARSFARTTGLWPHGAAGHQRSSSAAAANGLCAPLQRSRSLAPMATV
eukprot:TRINITY_DN37945_c0_g1_i1.p1 TRINITY_DN37945_c0_g1~~TRINITY_DN37945_c0_g1_i1.p1  ORF type:complete len:222 (-),score=36.35 TRINITY_DN37945_c0_g1_i1:74-739(-)